MNDLKAQLMELLFPAADAAILANRTMTPRWQGYVVWMICPNGHAWQLNSPTPASMLPSTQRRSKVFACTRCRPRVENVEELVEVPAAFDQDKPNLETRITRVRTSARKGYTLAHPDLTGTLTAAALLGPVSERDELYAGLWSREVYEAYKVLRVEVGRAWLKQDRAAYQDRKMHKRKSSALQINTFVLAKLLGRY